MSLRLRVGILVLGRLLARTLFGAIQDVLTGHARIARAAQRQETADDHAQHHENNHGGFHGGTIRIMPSWEVLATSLPSREKILPRANPRAPEALGLSVL